MKAILLAAGFGTRLKPLTNTTPKPLIDVNGVPLIFYNLALLKKHGIKDVVINLHYLGDQIKKLLGDGLRWGFRFQYSIEKKILGTGGGIRKALRYINDKSFLVMNADIITDINLTKLIATHRQKRPLTTLAVIESPLAKKFGSLEVNRHKQIVSILGNPKTNLKTRHTFFTGVQIIHRDLVTPLKARQKSCIVRQAYIPAVQAAQPIQAFIQKSYWNDLGTLSRLKSTTASLRAQKVTLSFHQQLGLLKKVNNFK